MYVTITNQHLKYYEQSNFTILYGLIGLMKTISVLLRILHERELEGIYGMLLIADIFL